MNKWKLAFWISLTLLVSVTVFSFYEILDQGVTITYMKQGYTDTENDLDYLMKIINETDLSKSEIQKVLSDHSLHEFMDFNRDTISLKRIELIFENEKLVNITKQW
jgi:hypothetical protein